MGPIPRVRESLSQSARSPRELASFHPGVPGGAVAGLCFLLRADLRLRAVEDAFDVGAVTPEDQDAQAQPVTYCSVAERIDEVAR